MVSTGSIGFSVQKAVNKLKKENINIEYYSSPFVSPVDVEFFKKMNSTVKVVFTVEEHVFEGGFGSSILETLSQINDSARVVRLALPKDISGIASQHSILSRFGLDEVGIYSQLRQHILEKQSLKRGFD